MNRAERRREQRNQGKKEVTRTMTLGQIRQMKQEMTELVADELLMKVFGIATLVKKEVDGKSREERFVDECERQYELFEKGRLTLEDIKETLKEECGITMERKNKRKREWE